MAVAATLRNIPRPLVLTSLLAATLAATAALRVLLMPEPATPADPAAERARLLAEEFEELILHVWEQEAGARLEDRIGLFTREEVARRLVSGSSDGNR